MGHKIWERYFLKETLKMLLFLLCCFYLLYVIIDYSSHSQGFAQADYGIEQISLYYLLNFIRRLDFLLPLAVLLATIRTVTTLNINNELVALMAGGVSLRRLMRPFLLIGCISTVFVLFISETGLPKAMSKLQKMEDSSFRKNRQQEEHYKLKFFNLEDETTVIYQNYHSAKKVFFDVYWLKNIDEIYHIKYLYPHAQEPIGRHVDVLKRDKYGVMKRSNSYDSYIFYDMHFNPTALLSELIPPKHQSISQLWKNLPNHFSQYSGREAELVSTFYYKLAIPLLCILVVLAPAYACTRFKRQQPLFMIYAIAIFSLVSYYTLMDAVLILGQHQVVQPFFAIWTPFLLLCPIIFWNYRKIA
ncbi:MAG: hypothetical protein CMO81_11250 [Waddliaceae bacterium]|nr:hypothetical protein [Waddliaceae bacterium]